MKIEKLLIVGQGICGTVLSSLCFQQNIPFMVVDHPAKGSASIPAAGILNPVVFKRMLPGWMADTLLPAAFKYYETMERLLGENFFHPHGILKIIGNENEEALWKKATANPFLWQFISAEEPTPEKYGEVLASHVTLGLIKASGWVDAPKFLSAWRKKLTENNLLQEEVFHYDRIQINTGQKIIYQNTEYSHVIFCEGVSAMQNPWFSDFPWVPTKGDLLLVKPAKEIPGPYILNRNGFLLPYGKEGLWLAGSTYHWDDFSHTPGMKGREEVVEKIKKIISVPFEIVDHWCGIRPGVTDRRPIIGAHKEHQQIIIFNGMGTKGFLLAPGLGEIFLSGKPLPSDCLPERFVKK